MMLLFFCLGDVRYAMKSDGIREICPLVETEKIPHAPDYVVGLIRYRGLVIPVADLRVFFHGQPCHARLSTRIIVVERSKNGGSRNVAGFMAEKVTEARYRPESALEGKVPGLSDIECISSVLMENNRAIHLIDTDCLCDSLFLSTAGQSAGP